MIYLYHSKGKHKTDWNGYFRERGKMKGRTWNRLLQKANKEMSHCVSRSILVEVYFKYRELVNDVAFLKNSDMTVQMYHYLIIKLEYFFKLYVGFTK